MKIKKECFMKIIKTKTTSFDFFKDSYRAPSLDLLSRQKNEKQFNYYLEEFLNEETREWEEFPVLFHRHGRFWDNGYEDKDKDIES